MLENSLVFSRRVIQPSLPLSNQILLQSFHHISLISVLRNVYSFEVKADTPNVRFQLHETPLTTPNSQCPMPNCPSYLLFLHLTHSLTHSNSSPPSNQLPQRLHTPNIPGKHHIRHAPMPTRLLITPPNRHPRRRLSQNHRPLHPQPLSRSITASDPTFSNDVARGDVDAAQELHECASDNGADF